MTVVGRQLSKVRQHELADQQGKGVQISPARHGRKLHRRGRDVTFKCVLNNEMLFKPSLCPNSSKALADASQEDVTAVLIVDIGGRACDVLPAGLEHKLGFDIFGRKASVDEEFALINDLKEEILKDKDQLKTAKKKAVRKITLDHPIKQLGRD